MSHGMRRNLSHTVNHGLRELTTDLYVGFFNLNRLYTTPPFRRFPGERNKRKCAQATQIKKRLQKENSRERKGAEEEREKERMVQKKRTACRSQV